MKKAVIALLLLIAFAMPITVFASTRTVQPTMFYACEATAIQGSIKVGDIDVNSITQDDTFTCSNSAYSLKVQWNVTGPKGDTGLQGDPGVQGTQGVQGPKGDTGATGTDGKDGVPGKDGTNGTNGTNGKDGISGMNFTQAACTETGLTGSAQQENLLFCVSGVAPNGSVMYTAAINAAKVHLLLGTPLASIPSVDWSGQAITYVSFTSGFHAEYHTDNIVRIYNTLNQRVA